jgi:hypothetical protein
MVYKNLYVVHSEINVDEEFRSKIAHSWFIFFLNAGRQNRT